MEKIRYVSSDQAIFEAMGRYTAEQSPNYFAEPIIQKVNFTEVTLRDGQQQQINEVTLNDRLEVFDNIVSTGIDRVEIGHLGNKIDQEFAGAVIEQIANKETWDPKYGNVKVQVLFGSQVEIIQEGIDVLRKAFQDNYGEKWREIMASKIVVHVYDRVDPELISASSHPYSPEQSAVRVCEAADQALGEGFVNFSVSGEAATAVSPETAIKYYRTINDHLFSYGAVQVNNNLANTYGFSASSLWNKDTLDIFNKAVKYGYGDQVTTSVHAHNDVNSAIEFSKNAIKAGFDRVEGTLIGMGERSGNVALADVMSIFLEQARHSYFEGKRGIKSKISELVGIFTVQKEVYIDETIADNVGSWHRICQKMADIYGQEASSRLHKTALGNPRVHDNGSGPHDQVIAAAIVDPLKNPGHGSYEWALLINAMMGRPMAKEIAIGDPRAVDQVTVANYAGGGKTAAIKNGTLPRAAEMIIEKASIEFENDKTQTALYLKQGFVLN